MSEEEIIKNIEDMLLHAETNLLDYEVLALQGLLDLYTHKKGRVEELKQELLEEKEKNIKLFEEYNKRVATIIKYEQEIKEIRNKVSLDKYTYEDFEEDLTKILEE